MTPEFEDADLTEKQRTFEAIARLGGEQGLGWFEEILRRPHPRWFASRRFKELLAAVAHGLVSVRSPRARAILEDLAATGDRLVRTVCREALREVDGDR